MGCLRQLVWEGGIKEEMSKTEGGVNPFRDAGARLGGDSSKLNSGRSRRSEREGANRRERKE
jgi:hypothetical protein